MVIKLLMISGNIYKSDTNCSSDASVVSSAGGSTTRSLPPKKRSIDKSDTNCSSATSVVSSASVATTRSLPPKKRRFVVHCTNDFSPSMDCFDHHASSTFSPPKTVYKPTIEAAAAANTEEGFAQRNIANALSSLFENCRSAMDAADLLVSLGRCAKAPTQLISTSNRYSSNNAASSKQQSPTLDYSVVFAQSATLALEQLQSSHALAQSSPYVAAKVALWNAYLKARAQL